MKSQNIMLIFLQIILLTFFQTTTSQTIEPQLDFLGGSCRLSDNITINGTYHTNVLTLLTKLHSLSSINQFVVDSVGEGPNTVNGYFLCRPDVDLATCESCFVAAAEVFTEYCFDKKEATIWYEECLIRYTNNSVSPSINATKPLYFNYGTLNVSKTEGFPELVSTSMTALISKAAARKDTTPRFYALHAQTNFTLFEGFYGMVLCRPDLTSEDCESCLTAALETIPICCADSLAAYTVVLMPNCQLRYDTAPFVFSALPPSPAS